MLKTKSPAIRQNDKTAITLYRASYRCLHVEDATKYAMLVLSFATCILAILNKYLPQMAKGVENVYAIQETISTYLNLASGVILVAGIAIGFYSSRMHSEGVALRDRYDAYVFDNPPNLTILKPVSQTAINVYSHKLKKPNETFKNAIYAPSDDPDVETAQFDYINKELHNDYKLLLSVQPFFLSVWIGFCVLIVILAVTFNDSFVTTLINILIPSLSAVSTIGNAWHSYHLRLRELQNLLSIIDQIQRLPDQKRYDYITDKRNVRALADGLFNYRMNAFTVPQFLVKRFNKKNTEHSITLQFDSETPTRKTEMPSLTLLDMDDDIAEITRGLNASRVKTVTIVRSSPRLRTYEKAEQRYTAQSPKSLATAKVASSNSNRATPKVAATPKRQSSENGKSSSSKSNKNKAVTDDTPKKSNTTNGNAKKNTNKQSTDTKSQTSKKKKD